MKVIAERFWREPAVAIGLLTMLALVVINIIGDSGWDVDNIIAIVAPLVSALGIRQAVYSPATVEELTAPKQPEPK